MSKLKNQENHSKKNLNYFDSTIDIFQNASSGDSDSFFDRFPKITAAIPRTLYFDKLDPDRLSKLSELGYDPVILTTLPRTTLEQEREYLRCKSQAVEEGTVVVSKHELAALEIKMKAAGMFEQKRVNTNVHVSLDSEDMELLLNWNQSRHTLQGNSTIIDLDEVLKK